MLELVLEVLGVLAISPALHAMKWAANPVARVVLSILPDLVGAYRRAQGKAGAEGAPNVLPTLCLVLGLGAALQGCGGNPPPPVADISACLFKMNAALDGKNDCESIVKAITSVVVDDPKCSELLLHGLKCGPKDGGP